MIERVKKIIEYYGLSDRGFAISCGLNQPTLFNQLKGLRNLSLDTVRAIATTYPEISCDWIITGAGSMLKEDSASRESERLSKLVDTITTLQSVISDKDKVIATLTEQVNQLKSKTK